MNDKDTAQELRQFTYWCGADNPASRDIHPPICDKAADLIESLQAQLAEAKENHVDDYIRLQTELAAEKAKNAELQHYNISCTKQAGRLLLDRAELMQLRNFLRKYDYPDLDAWISAYNQQNNLLSASQARERAAVEDIPHSCEYCANARIDDGCKCLPDGDTYSPDYTEGFDRDNCEHWQWRGQQQGGDAYGNN